MALTGRTIVEGAARELGVLGQGQAMSGTMAALFLGNLSDLIDDWNAQREMIYATSFLTFAFTPGLSPHTIGPSTATWTVAQRPMSIEGAVVATGSGTTQVNAPPMRLHDVAAGIPTWYQSLSSPNIATSYPTDGYYDPTWPNGSFYLWPVPSAAYNCQIQVRGVLTDYALDTAFSMPPGYRSALILTLAEDSAGMFGRPMPQGLSDRALRARALIASNNTGGHRVRTQDAGMPRGGRSRRSNFNYLTGNIR